ncbi:MULTISPECIES: flagellar filament capping protein FliD [unclassified Vibrio]|uniref:flagellar filament capping protein FliD n=1 Tax=unclassified Vibrio TaxID=2614977 RepID=UPI001483567F|nr:MULTISPECIES: flagellar filament capping protein FliD [unclassified Vibrio]NNN43238.1 flagellar filament capping protein FliD [Vibrio sp. 1-1(7)]NNN71062.1 flagellar filament capping protein FliD [Vibrio sp. 12-2(3-a)]
MSLGPMGMNTGFDINNVVSTIVNAERVPKQQSIDNKRNDIDTSISAYGRLRESLDTMKHLMANFRQEKAFAVRKVDTSNDNVISATANTEAMAGKYAVDVLQLAQNHKVASEVIPSETKFGPGKLQVSLGSKSFTVEVTNNATLSDVVRGINNQKNNPGVRASIINDVQGPRLIVASNLSGEKNRLSIRADAESNNALKRLEYKTLEDRIKDLEAARAQAQQLLAPLTPEQQKVAAKVADKLGEAARELDEQVKTQTEQLADKVAGEESSEIKVAEQVNRYLKPEERIPGWTETASGTLLDSYSEPEPELDDKALAKAPDVPGWSNTASGTLTDSYVTPKEAQAKLDAKLAREKAAIDEAVKSGKITPEEAKAAQRAKLPVEERDALEAMENVQRELKSAQDSFDAYQGMIQVQAGQDSQVLLDGIATLSSDNNVIENAIEGVNLTLKGKTDPGQTPTAIDIEYDRDSVRQDIEQFVASYNQFYQISKELSGVNPNTGQAGPLAGDSIVRSADSRLKAVFSSPIEQAPANLKSLTEFGITTTRQGTLEINYAMLNRQLNTNFTQLGEFFGGNQGFAKRVEDAIQGLTGATGSIRNRENSLSEQTRRLSKDQDALDRRMDGLEKRTHAKFSAMQDATGKMQSQLASMMNALGQ